MNLKGWTCDCTPRDQCEVSHTDPPVSPVPLSVGKNTPHCTSVSALLLYLIYFYICLLFQTLWDEAQRQNVQQCPGTFVLCCKVNSLALLGMNDHDGVFRVTEPKNKSCYLYNQDFTVQFLCFSTRWSQPEMNDYQWWGSDREFASRSAGHSSWFWS